MPEVRATTSLLSSLPETIRRPSGLNVNNEDGTDGYAMTAERFNSRYEPDE